MTVPPESEILSPIDQKIHSDDWPIHHLKRVNVISQQTQQCVSLLESHKDHAVQVTGVLAAIDSSQGQKIHDRRCRSQRIEINNVSFWAFSQEEDKSVSLWASGSAGWFELHDPVPQYRDIFCGMDEAVSMLYYLADKWRRSRRSYAYMKNKDLDRYVKSVFRDYLTTARDQESGSNPDAWIGKFHNRARFLITSMLEGQDNLDWHKSPFLRYFHLYFQDLYEEAEFRLHPERQSKRDKMKEPVIAANDQHKKTSMPPSRAPFDGHMRTHRIRSRNDGEEIPHTPRQSNRHLGDTDTSGDEEYDSDGKVIGAGTKRKSRSILRPKGSKFSKKGSGRRQSLPAIADDDEDANAKSEIEAEVPEPSPLAAVQARPQDAAREAPRESSYPYYLPRKVTEVKMVAYDIPTDQRQGPGDLWTCAFENCNHRVHQASKPKGKAQIKEHFQDHARKAQEKIDLALSEARPYLPVSNLVRRIQQVQAKVPSHPAPITRRY